ncbi:MAG: hypothetical protein JWO53_890, partial [Chlamydiia bacterium]|nr:hypothetical protein [Chlamydiia bacterium]
MQPITHDLYSEKFFPTVIACLQDGSKWCKNGSIVALPIGFKLPNRVSFFQADNGKYASNHKLVMTAEFLESELGKQLVPFGDDYLKSCKDQMGEKSVAYLQGLINQ